MEEKEAVLNCQNSSPPNKHRRLSGSDDAPDPYTIARFCSDKFSPSKQCRCKRFLISFQLPTGSFGYGYQAEHNRLPGNRIWQNSNRSYVVKSICTFDSETRQLNCCFLVPTAVLVFQQVGVIKMHTDLKVREFHGEQGVDFFNRENWNKHLEQYEVFVMTPQILVDILSHSHFQLERIKLLIFDECHHARKKHAYARIMTEFYHPQLKSNPTNLPRIFGMTASLVNTKGSSKRSVYGGQIAKIESLMHSKVYTVASESVLAKYVPFSTAKIMEYNHVEIPHELLVCISSLLVDLNLKHRQSLQNQMLGTEEVSITMKKLKKLKDTLLFCLKEPGLLAAVKASDTLSRKESNLVFWGENTDGKCDKIVREFSYDVLKALSKYLPVDCVRNRKKRHLVFRPQTENLMQ